MKNKIRICAIMLITAGMLTQYTNCAEKLPDNITQASTATVTVPPPLTAQNPLVLSVNPPTILVSQTAQITVTGGTAPYIYSVTAGGISVSASGLVSATAVGAATVEVTDQNGNHASISVSVVSMVTGAGASCTTSFGQSVPHGGQVNVYPSATVGCPATCVAQTLTCNNGTLVGAAIGAGSSGTCSVRACVWKQTFAGNCPTAGLNPPFYPVPDTCSAAEFNRYLCATPGLVKFVNEYRCSSP